MTMFAKSGKPAAANTRLAMLNVRRELATRGEFAAEINRLVDQGLETMVEAGRRLAEAKAALPHGEFEAMLREDLDLDPSAAYRLRVVAEFVDSGAVPREDLPGHYSKIFILATLTPEQLEAARSRGLVSTRVTKRQLEAFKRECEGKGPTIEDAGIGLLIAAPSSGAAPAAPVARVLEPADPPRPSTVREPEPAAELTPAPPSSHARREELEKGLVQLFARPEQPSVPPIYVVEQAASAAPAETEVEGEPRPPTGADLTAVPWYVDEETLGVVMAYNDGVTVLMIDPHRDTGLNDAAIAVLATHIVKLHNATLTK